MCVHASACAFISPYHTQTNSMHPQLWQPSPSNLNPDNATWDTWYHGDRLVLHQLTKNPELSGQTSQMEHGWSVNTPQVRTVVSHNNLSFNYQGSIHLTPMPHVTHLSPPMSSKTAPSHTPWCEAVISSLLFNPLLLVCAYPHLSFPWQCLLHCTKSPGRRVRS